MNILLTAIKLMIFTHAAQPSWQIAVDFKIDNNLPIMSLILEKNSKQASFFTTIATLGTPLDLTTQELRIELLFPSGDIQQNLAEIKLGYPTQATSYAESMQFGWADKD